jgi:hypothetical protein
MKILVVLAIVLTCLLVSSLFSFNVTNVIYDKQPVFARNQQKYVLGANPDGDMGDDDRWAGSDLGDDDNWE